jgi:uncharacterized protein YqeY
MGDIVMGMRAQVKDALVVAMKAKNEAEKLALRQILAAMTDAEKLEGKALTDADEEKVVAKKLKELGRVIEEYQRLGQTERVQALELERAVYQRYAPKPMDHADLVRLVEQTIAELGATSPGDLGKVMPAVMAKTAGQADGAAVRRLVQERLQKPA